MALSATSFARILRRATAPGIAAASALLPVSGGVPAGEVLPGPVPAEVVAVHDGDTVTARARIWIGQEVEIRVRLEGIDAPELRGRCARERALAREARALLRRQLEAGGARLRDIHYGKFAGRVVARVLDREGRDVADALLAAGLARPYEGGRRRPWCPPEAARR